MSKIAKIQRASILMVEWFVLIFTLSCCADKKINLFSGLEEAFNLSPIQTVGRIDNYLITTVYLDMDDQGKVNRKTVLEGLFSRKILHIQKEKRIDAFKWKYVKKGERKGPGEISEYTVLPYSKDFQYTFKDWKREHFPVDLSAIPKSMEGWRFVVLLIDAHTFDVLINTNLYKGSIANVGDSATLPSNSTPISIDFPPLFTDSYFIDTPVKITFQGITLYQKEPCAILAFRSDNNSVHMKTNMNNMTFSSDGTSYYWGEIFLSLKDRNLLKGKIIERVDLITNLVTLNQPIKHVTRREITLQRIPDS